MSTRLTKASGLSTNELGLTSASNKIAKKIERVLMEDIRNADSLEIAVSNLTSRDILRDLVPLTDDLIGPLMRVVEDAARDAIASLPASIGISIRFDQSDIRALRWAQQRAGQFIVEISEEVRLQVRAMITRAIREQFTPERLATYIRQIVGLHSRWAQAVNNMYDRTRDELLGQGMPLGQAESRALAMATKYQDRLVRTRAITIARTEVIAAQNAGRFLGWQQAMAQTGIPGGMLRKRWQVGPEGWGGIHVCDVCLSLSNVEVGVNDMFPTGRMMPPAHPNCRCTAILIFPSEEL